MFFDAFSPGTDIGVDSARYMSFFKVLFGTYIDNDDALFLTDLIKRVGRDESGSGIGRDGDRKE